MSRHARLVFSAFGLVFTVAACGMATQDLGHDRPADPDAPPPPPPAAPDGSPALPAATAPGESWQWLSPAPQGNRIRGVGGSADDDVWLVGDGNTVLHWDGEKWNDQHGSLRGLDLYSVWSSGPNDVWAAGDSGVEYQFHGDAPSIYTRHLNAGGGAILHFDGKEWRRDPQIGTRWAHAIWGADATHVFALLEHGDVGRFDGTSWSISTSPAKAVLRDVWGSSASNIWAVGDGGTIAHFDGASWSTIPRGTGDPKTDPTAPTNAYYGVWGSSADDVWAAFVDPTSATSTYPSQQAIGFAHWDGIAWKVSQTILTAQSSSEMYAPHTSEPFRLGHLVWGGDGARALAVSFGAFDVLAYDGKTWSKDATLSTAGIRTLWGRPGPGALFAGGEGGALYRFDGAAASGKRLVEVFPAFRQSLRSLEISGEDVWAIANRASGSGGDLVRWTTGGWSRVHVTAANAEGDARDVSVMSLAVAAKDDVWITGEHPLRDVWYDEMAQDVLHWDGGRWSSIPLPEKEVRLGFGRVWAPKGSARPWFISRYAGRLYRLTGTMWTSVSLPGGFEATTIGGSSDDDIWVLANRSGGTTVGHVVVFHLEPTGFVDVFHADGTGYGCEVAAASPTDVWVRSGPAGMVGTPNITYHFDGKSWTDRRDLDAIRIWPAGDGKTFFLAFDGAEPMFAPADVRHVLGFWDGASKTIVGETSASVVNLAATKEALWIAGEGGATLRYPLAKPPR